MFSMVTIASGVGMSILGVGTKTLPDYKNPLTHLGGFTFRGTPNIEPKPFTGFTFGGTTLTKHALLLEQGRVEEQKQELVREHKQVPSLPALAHTSAAGTQVVEEIHSRPRDAGEMDKFNGQMEQEEAYKASGPLAGTSTTVTVDQQFREAIGGNEKETLRTMGVQEVSAKEDQNIVLPKGDMFKEPSKETDPQNMVKLEGEIATIVSTKLNAMRQLQTNTEALQDGITNPRKQKYSDTVRYVPPHLRHSTDGLRMVGTRRPSPRLSSPRLLSPRLSRPRLSSPRLLSPRLLSPKMPGTRMPTTRNMVVKYSGNAVTTKTLSIPNLTAIAKDQKNLKMPSKARASDLKLLLQGAMGSLEEDGRKKAGDDQSSKLPLMPALTSQAVTSLVSKQGIDSVINVDKKVEGCSSHLDEKVEGSSIDLDKKVEGGYIDLGMKVEGGSINLDKKVKGSSIDLGKNLEGGCGSIDLDKKVEGSSIDLGKKVEGGSIDLGKTVEGGSIDLGKKVEGGSIDKKDVEHGYADLVDKDVENGSVNLVKKDLEGGNQTETILDESQIIEISCRKVNSWLAGEKGCKEQEETNEDSAPLSSAASNTSWHSCKSSSKSSSSLSPAISSKDTTSKSSLSPTNSSGESTSKSSLSPTNSSEESTSKSYLSPTNRSEESTSKSSLTPANSSQATTSKASLTPAISSQATICKASLTKAISSQANTSKASLTPDISSQFSTCKNPLPGTYRGPKVHSDWPAEQQIRVGPIPMEVSWSQIRDAFGAEVGKNKIKHCYIQSRAVEGVLYGQVVLANASIVSKVIQDGKIKVHGQFIKVAPMLSRS